jgi:hypothetical protein
MITLKIFQVNLNNFLGHISDGFFKQNNNQELTELSQSMQQNNIKEKKGIVNNLLNLFKN